MRICRVPTFVSEYMTLKIFGSSWILPQSEIVGVRLELVGSTPDTYFGFRISRKFSLLPYLIGLHSILTSRFCFQLNRI